MNKSFYASFITILFLAVGIYSQSPSDSIITGKKYKIILFDDREVIGTVTGQDTLMVYVKSADGFYRLKKEDIFAVSRELTPSKFKVMFWAGAGISFFGNDYDGYGGNKTGLALQLGAMYPINVTKGIRLDIGYSRWKNDRSEQPQYYPPYTYFGEQTVQTYFIKVDFVFGSFNPSESFKIYGFAGAGAHFKNESSYSTTYYSSYDSTYYTSYYPERNYSNFMFSLGGGAGYNFTKNLGAYTELQYNSAGYFYFFGGGFFLAKAGLTYTLF
ncbi:MAG: hypothetical protein L0Y79_00450 [Chlorobi bacterium]|nr:hypothetical protein [Chlorobiota bacterium]MCI0714885.1 hypothetical protein [Chlorobiota bacterium]